MLIVLPKDIYVKILPVDEQPSRKNHVVVDGCARTIGNEVLLIYQILAKNRVKPAGEDGHSLSYSISDPEVERWVRSVINGGKTLLVKAIGYWCDFLPIASRENPLKPEENGDYVRAGFFTTVTEKTMPPFFYSVISKKAFYSGEPAVLEDYIWLAEALGKHPSISFEAIENFIKDLRGEWGGVHLFYTQSGLRRIVEGYAVAVSTRLYKIYGEEWRRAVTIAVFDHLMSDGAHPIVKVLLNSVEQGEVFGQES